MKSKLHPDTNIYTRRTTYNPSTTLYAALPCLGPHFMHVSSVSQRKKGTAQPPRKHHYVLVVQCPKAKPTRNQTRHAMSLDMMYIIQSSTEGLCDPWCSMLSGYRGPGAVQRRTDRRRGISPDSGCNNAASKQRRPYCSYCAVRLKISSDVWMIHEILPLSIFWRKGSRGRPLASWNNLRMLFIC